MEETRGYYSEHVAAVCRKQGMDVTPDYAGKPNAVPLPATMVHELSDSLSHKEDGYTMRLYSRFPFPTARTAAYATASRRTRCATWRPNPTGEFWRREDARRSDGAFRHGGRDGFGVVRAVPQYPSR